MLVMLLLSPFTSIWILIKILYVSFFQLFFFFGINGTKDEQHWFTKMNPVVYLKRERPIRWTCFLCLYVRFAVFVWAKIYKKRKEKTIRIIRTWWLILLQQSTPNVQHPLNKLGIQYFLQLFVLTKYVVIDV